MNQDANIQGFLDKHRVAPYRSGNVYNMFDGKSIDLMVLDNIELKSKKDCEELIKFLEVHKFCFPQHLKTNTP